MALDGRPARAHCLERHRPRTVTDCPDRLTGDLEVMNVVRPLVVHQQLPVEGRLDEVGLARGRQEASTASVSGYIGVVLVLRARYHPVAVATSGAELG
jgi:hypothetical protein